MCAGAEARRKQSGILFNFCVTVYTYSLTSTPSPHCRVASCILSNLIYPAPPPPSPPAAFPPSSRAFASPGKAVCLFVICFFVLFFVGFPWPRAYSTYMHVYIEHSRGLCGGGGYPSPFHLPPPAHMQTYARLRLVGINELTSRHQT